MSKAQRPKPQVGGCVGDTAEAVLDGVDRLVHDDVRKIKLQAEGKQE